MAGAPPLTFDMATSAIALFGVLTSKAKGEPLPEGVAYGKDGGWTRDAAEALEGGAIATRGGGSKGWTPTHCAAAVGNVECIRLLLGSGQAVASATSADGLTPLQLAQLLQQIEPGLGGRAVYSLLEPAEG